MRGEIALLLASALAASAAVAAPKIESVVVKPNPAQFGGDKAPEVEIVVAVSRTRFDSGSCDARLDFGDGQGRTLDFGVAATRTVRHVYKKGGSYTVAARGAGASPCEGSQQAGLTVAQAPEPKKPEPKKPEPKKAEPEKKKVEEKSAPAKKASAKKAPAKKKPAPKKKSAKKDEKKEPGK